MVDAESPVHKRNNRFSNGRGRLPWKEAESVPSHPGPGDSTNSELVAGEAASAVDGTL